MAPEACSAAEIVDPFGEGSTSLGTGSHSISPAGDSDGAGTDPSCVASSRPTASAAPSRAAYDAARSSFHANENTCMPRSTAIVTEVEKLSTSTTTHTSASVASAPGRPQSKRTAWSRCPKMSSTDAP